MGMLGPWGGHSVWHAYQWPRPTPDNYPVLKRQWNLSVLRDVNHPSAGLYCMGNESGGGTDFPRIAWQCYRDTKAIKPTALVIWTDGGHNPDLPGDFVNDDAAKDRQCELPLIQHEYRWWSSYPDVRQAEKFSGAVRPFAIDLAVQAARSRGLEGLLPSFAQNSQRLQFLEAKAKMEACRRDNPRLAGICHFTAMDFGFSPQGIVDAFYDRKYADVTSWHQTNGDTVVLSSLGFDDRVLCGGETLRAALYVSDFSHPPLEHPVLRWEFLLDGDAASSGGGEYEHTPYVTCAAGEIAVELPTTSRPRSALLRASVSEGERAFTNQWNLWLLPRRAPLPPGPALYGKAQHTWLKDLTRLRQLGPDDLGDLDRTALVLTERLDEALADFMRRGGRVILAAGEGLVRPHPPNFGYVKYFFTPPANYGPFEDGQNGTVIADHPMLGGMPHEGFADLQFFRLMENAPPLDVAPLGLEAVEPAIRVIHRYQVCRPLTYLMEGRVGEGGVILCALELDQSLPEGRFLLAATCAYASSAEFRPADGLSAETLRRLVAATSLG